jgi:hypothetical protein
MSERVNDRVTNAEVAAALSRVEGKLDELTRLVGPTEKDGLRGEVKELVAIKNKGWGFISGIVLLAGAAGAAVKSAITELLS